MTTESLTNMTPKQKRQPRGIQPKTQASKNRTVVAARRNEIIKSLLDGKTAQQAGIEAGFSPRTAGVQVSQTLKNPQVQSRLIAALENTGLTEDCLAQHLLSLLNGKRYLTRRGDVDALPPPNPSDPNDVAGYIAVPDLQAKAKSLEMIYKMLGAFTEKHELDIKRPVNVTIRKFCSQGAEDSPA